MVGLYSCDRTRRQRDVTNKDGLYGMSKKALDMSQTYADKKM